MALKRFDVPDIDEAISDAKSEEQRKQELETADRIVAAIEIFIEKSPVVVKAMREIAMSLAPNKFSSQIDAELKKTTDEIAELFKSKVKPMIDKMETSSHRIAIPSIAVYVSIISLLWMFAFLALVIYANTYIHSGQLTNLISSIIICWIVTVALTVYLTRKFKW